MAVAAYNIGFGHLEDARIITQMQGGNPDNWEEVRERLPLLSDESWYKRVQRGFARGSVPVTYVDNVRRYFGLLQWMAGTEILSERPRPKAEPLQSAG
jgi:membrane-bound lytic murein transglycosylase F